MRPFVILLVVAASVGVEVVVAARSPQAPQTSTTAGVATLPRLRDGRPPDYPRVVTDLVSSLTLKFTVDTSGRVGAIEVLDERHGIMELARRGTITSRDAERFRQAASKALESWRYEVPPATMTAFVRFEFYPKAPAQVLWHSELPPQPVTAGRVLLPNGTVLTAVRIGGEVTVPRRQKHADPLYPDVARSARVGATMVVNVVVSETGDVLLANLVRSVPIFDDAALRAVRQWKYEPLHVNGVPTAFVVAVAIVYDPDSRPSQPGVGVVLDPR
jgi:TonB family protein